MLACKKAPKTRFYINNTIQFRCSLSDTTLDTMVLHSSLLVAISAHLFMFIPVILYLYINDTFQRRVQVTPQVLPNQGHGQLKRAIYTSLGCRVGEWSVVCRDVQSRGGEGCGQASIFRGIRHQVKVPGYDGKPGEEDQRATNCSKIR